MKKLFSSPQIKTIAIVFTAVLSMTLPCCKKQTTATGNKMGILTSATWRLTAFTIYTITGQTDIYATYPDCRKDDYRQFNEDGTVEINEGLSKCNSADPQSQSMQWRFLNQYQTRIEINGEEYIIDRLENNEFRIATPSNSYSNQKVLLFNR